MDGYTDLWLKPKPTEVKFSAPKAEKMFRNCLQNNCSLHRYLAMSRSSPMNFLEIL
jgi:hypothetical protein